MDPGILKFWIRRSTVFIKFFGCSRPRLRLAPLFGGIVRDTRRRGLNSPCISPYLGFRARSGCRREHGDLGGNERAEPPRCMARDSLSDECIRVSFTSYPIRWQVGPAGRRALKFIHGKIRSFSLSTLASARKYKSPSFSPVQFERYLSREGEREPTRGRVTQKSFNGLTTRDIAE